jgi:hypothetical protein
MTASEPNLQPLVNIHYVKIYFNKYLEIKDYEGKVSILTN